MVLKCHVSLLDGSEADFEVGKNAKASTLLDEVCKHLNVVEKDYFGLIYKGSKLQKAWLTLDKKIKKQINKRGKIEFEFCLKFYPTDPTKLKEEITRYQVCLQIRKDLSQDLSCSVEKLTHLLSYWLQSEFQGKNDNAKVVKDCLKDFKNPPKEAESAEFVDRVLTLYRERRDMPSAEADIQFVAVAAGLRLYGIHFYRGKEAAGNETLLGIGAKGVTEVRDGQSPVSHTWSRIKNIGYKSSKFKLKLLRAPSNGDPRLKKSFLFDSESQVHGMWKSAVEHHVFFRVGEKDKKPSDGTKKPKKKKSSLLRRFSSKKKKTEADVQEESKGITRNPPTVTRTSSLRRSASLRTSTSSELSFSAEHRDGASAPKPGKGSYLVSKEPQMDSESSSEAESTKPEKVEKPPEQNTVKLEVIPVQGQPNQEQQDIDEQPDGREYKNEDLMEAVIGKMEGTASGGSSTLLLTETIPEEDEGDHHGLLPSPRKRIYPVKFSPLRDDEASKDPISRDNAKNDKKSSHHLETDLDAEVLLSPVAPSKRDEDHFKFNPVTVKQDDTNVTARYRISIEHTETTQERTEVWKDVTVTPKQSQIENSVKFAPNANGPLKEDLSESGDAADEPKEPTSSSSPTSSEEGEVRFNAEGDPQMQKLPEDEVLKVQEISVPTFTDTYRQNEEDEEFHTITEYIPKLRKDSSEEETEYEEEADIQDELPLDNEKERVEIEEDLLQKSDSELNDESENEEYISPEALSSDPLSSDNLLLDLEQPNGYLTGAYGLESRKEEHSVEEEYEDDFETDTSEERRNQDEITEEIKPDTFEEENYEVGGQDSNEERDSVKMASVKHDVDDKPPINSVPKEISYRSPTRSVTIDFRMGENYKMTALSTNGKGERLPDGAASTTAATIGDGDDLEMEELDDDILYGREHAEQNERKDDDRRSEDDKEEQAESQPTPPGESTSRSTSLSDITDNTDELLEANVLEKAWSQGAGLDEDDELFQILFRTPPRRRKHRNRSEINLRDVEKGKREAMAFRTTLHEEPVSPRRRENLSKRPFIPSWPFDPMSLLDSRDLGDLDKDALTAALDAQRELLEESKRLEDMAMLDDFDLPPPDNIGYKQEEKPIQSPRKEKISPSWSKKEAEFLGARSRSPSASPRMVGEEFIPGVPDFVHSVLPYQLPTPMESGESEQNSIRASPVPAAKDPIDPESMKFPQSIIKFSGPTVNKEKLTYSPPPGVEILPQYKRSAEDFEILEYSEAAVQDNAKSATKHIASSGRSTPQSGAGNTSQSEGTTSTNSKSSSSSFPRFIHSVFPLRRSSSNDGRGRSKTRRKREKKITKQKSKKKHRSKSKDKKNSEKTVPVVEITAPTDANAFKPFPVLPSPPHYSSLPQPHSSDQLDQRHSPLPKYGAGSQNAHADPKSQYDQESLDKIILSESDDAHSDSGTPETVRRVEGFRGDSQPLTG